MDLAVNVQTTKSGRSMLTAVAICPKLAVVVASSQFGSARNSGVCVDGATATEPTSSKCKW